MRTMRRSICRIRAVQFFVVMTVAGAGAAIAPCVLSAQQPSDSTRVVRDARTPLTIWISGGLGISTLRAAAVSADLNVTYGDVFETFRVAETEQIFGDGVKDQALMSGFRLGDRHAFVTGAVGPTFATHFHNCDCGTPTTDVGQLAFGFEVGVHRTLSKVGAGLTLYRLAGGGKESYTALTVVLDVGWFGVRR